MNGEGTPISLEGARFRTSYSTPSGLQKANPEGAAIMQKLKQLGQNVEQSKRKLQNYYDKHGPQSE